MGANGTLGDPDLIAQIAAFGEGRGQRGSAVLDRFIRHFYRRLPPEDLARREVADLHAAAQGMFAFLRCRAADTDKLRIYNPDPDRDGWASPHTTIDLVTGDRPFIIDSVAAELNRQGSAIHFLAHPTFRVVRDEAGALRDLRAADEELSGVTELVESVVRIEIDRQADDGAMDALAARFARVLKDGRYTVEDWGAMRDALDGARDDLADGAPPGADSEEGAAFLRWLAARHFTFLGYRRLDLTMDGEIAALAEVPGTALGILRRADDERDAEGPRRRPLPRDVLEQVTEASPLIVYRSARRSTVHRPAPMIVVEAKRRRRDGAVVGIHRFLGLFTSSAYGRSPTEVPLLRRKVAAVLERAGFTPDSHDGRSLLRVLETFPRDELFPYDVEALFETGIAILHLRRRPRLRLFVRRDHLAGAVSCLVFVPRERYDTGMRRRVVPILEEAFGGVCEAFFTQLDDGPLARPHAIVRVARGVGEGEPVEAVEARLIDVIRGWDDGLHAALGAAWDERRAATFERRYGAAFPPGYRDRFPPPWRR